MSNVQVAVRVRPFNSREKKAKSKMVVFMKGNQTTLKKDSKDKGRQFTFDFSFWSHDPNKPEKYSGQADVFKSLGKVILDNVFKGYNASLLAYGQTGSGKSYSMMGGGGESRGVIPRLSEALFEKAAEEKKDNVTYKVEISYLEIYSERIRDLLAPTSKKENAATSTKGLKVREDPETGPYVDGLLTCAVGNFKELKKLMTIGNKTRTVAATNMNAQSSRSHAVMSVKFTTTTFDEMTSLSSNQTSKIQLVDLAGSERVSKSGVKGVGLKEAAMINKSLTTLGMVISSLAKKGASSKKKKKGRSKVFIPYRDSVLTWLLRESLGGNSKTVMIAALSPANINYEETLSTLRYADRMKQIVNKAKVNEDPNAALIRELRAQIMALKKQLAAGGGGGAAGDDSAVRELQEKLIKNKLEQERERREWEEKLSAARRAAEMGETALDTHGMSSSVDLTVPHVINLNEDPQMNETVVHYVREPGQTVLVSSRFRRGTSCIQLYGQGMEDPHCYLLRNESGAVSLQLDAVDKDGKKMQAARGKTFVNGRLLSGAVSLRHGDRVMFGAEQIFRFFLPDAKESGKPLGWSEAMAELEASSEFKSYREILDSKMAELEVLRRREEERRKLAEMRMIKKLKKIRRSTMARERKSLMDANFTINSRLKPAYTELLSLVDEMNAIMRALGILGDTMFKVELVGDGAQPVPVVDSRMAQVVADFQNEEATELKAASGDEVEVIFVNKEGWALARNGGNVGWIPSSYLQPEYPADPPAEPWALLPAKVRQSMSSKLEIRAFRPAGSRWIPHLKNEVRYRAKWDVDFFLARLKSLRRVYHSTQQGLRRVNFNSTKVLMHDKLRAVGVSSVRLYPLIYRPGNRLSFKTPVLDTNGNCVAFLEAEMELQIISDSVDARVDVEEGEDFEDEVMKIGAVATGVPVSVLVRVVRLTDINSSLLPIPHTIQENSDLQVELLVRHAFWKAHPHASRTRAITVGWDENSGDLFPYGPRVAGEQAAAAAAEQGDDAGDAEAADGKQEEKKEEKKSNEEEKKGEEKKKRSKSPQEVKAIAELKTVKDKVKAERAKLVATHTKIRTMRQANLRVRQKLATDIGKTRKTFGDVKKVLKTLQARQQKVPEDDSGLSAAELAERKKKRLLQAKLSEKIGVLKKKIQAINAGYNKLRGAFQKSQKDSETLLKKEATFKKLQTEVQKKHATDVRSVLVKIKAIRVREAQEAAAKAKLAEVEAKKAEAKKKMDAALEGSERVTLTFQPTRLGMVFAHFRVLEVRDDSQAANLGVKKGWTLVRANGRDITEDTNIRELFIHFQELGNPIELEFSTATKDHEERIMEMEEDISWVYRLRPLSECGYQSIGLRGSPNMADVVRDDDGFPVEVGFDRQEFVVIERLHDILSNQIFLRLEDGRGWVFELDPKDLNNPILELVSTNEITSKTDKAGKAIKGGGRPASSPAERAMLAAAKRKEFEQVRKALDSKVDPNVVGGDQYSVLHIAARHGDLRTIQLLMERKANPNLRGQKGNSPLVEASWNGLSDAVGLLLDRRANVNHRTENGNTALHWGAFKGFNNVVEALLEHKAKPDIPNFKGRTPLHYAFRQHNDDIVTLLQPAIETYAAYERKNRLESIMWGQCEYNKDFRHSISVDQMTPEFLSYLADGTLSFELWMRFALRGDGFSQDVLDDCNEEQLVDKLAQVQQLVIEAKAENDMLKQKELEAILGDISRRLGTLRDEGTTKRTGIFRSLRMEGKDTSGEIEGRGRGGTINVSLRMLDIEGRMAEQDGDGRTSRRIIGSVQGSAAVPAVDTLWKSARLFMSVDVAEVDSTSKRAEFRPVRTKKDDASKKTAASGSRLDNGTRVIYRLSTAAQRQFVVSVVQADKNEFVLEAIKSVTVKYFYLSTQPLDPFRLDPQDSTLEVSSQNLFANQRMLRCEVLWSPAMLRHRIFSTVSGTGERVVMILDVQMYVRDTVEPVSVEYRMSAKMYKKMQTMERKYLNSRLHELGAHFEITKKVSDGKFAEVQGKSRKRAENFQEAVEEEYERQHSEFLKGVTDVSLRDEADALFQTKGATAQDAKSPDSKSPDASNPLSPGDRKMARRKLLTRFKSMSNITLSPGKADPGQAPVYVNCVPQVDEEIVIKSGFLHKLETFSAFRRRWFELRPPYLHYGKSMEQVTGVISLIDADVKRNTSYSKYPFSIEVVERETKNSHILSAATERDMNEWIELLSPKPKTKPIGAVPADGVRQPPLPRGPKPPNA